MEFGFVGIGLNLKLNSVRSSNGACALKKPFICMVAKPRQESKPHAAGSYFSTDHFEVSAAPFESAALHKLPAVSEYKGDSLQDDLSVVQKYAKDLDNAERSPIVNFLNGCLFQNHGDFGKARESFNRAIQYGMQHIPDVYERLSSVVFSSGDVNEAENFSKQAIQVRSEVVGNPEHIYNWFSDTFAESVPKWTGKPWSLQRGIIHYLAGNFTHARESLVVSALANLPESSVNSEYAMWDLASLAHSKGVSKVKTERLTQEELACAPDALCELLELFRETDIEHAQDMVESIEYQLEKQNLSAIEHKVAAQQRFYLGLYFDAFLIPNAKAESVREELIRKRNTLLLSATQLGLDNVLNTASEILIHKGK
eukprot:CAMPEP_0182446262 /NCGR_PEP_ID=MMETSP1172-20130603/4087_1 /TAXON_ID=708627 /ORGANISM="Timspurckia oligopyrenoides, Strain CCMP3278" /LENGTH=368 /DNA_ID=CAMNT_0024642167 /DNA_START=63 /DNA_END=1169 /DNA_ORIENTATION=-